MTAAPIAFKTTLLGAALLASLPALAGGKTEDPARIIANAPAAHVTTSTLGPGSVMIDFETLSAGATVSNQYSAMGVVFSPSPYTGSGGPTGDWASNSDMTIAAVGGGNTGALGTPSLVSGKILHSYNGWLAEDGDASFLMTFSAPITSISIDFAGISKPASTGIDIYNTSGDYVTSVFATKTGQQTLTYTGSNIGYVAVTPGDFEDWVGVDNINFLQAGAVPEPETYGLLALGLGIIGIAVRRRQR